MQSLQLGIAPASAVTRGLQKIEILLDIQYVKSSSERKKQYRGKRPNKNKRPEIKSTLERQAGKSIHDFKTGQCSDRNASCSL